MKVLVLDYETSAEEWSEGLAALARGCGMEAAPEILYRHAVRPVADEQEELAELIAENQVEVMIVDSVERACGGGSGEGWHERAARLFAALRSLPVTALLIDHQAATDIDSNGASLKAFGSVLKMAWARQAFCLKREEEGSEALLINTKADSLSPKLRPLGLRFVYENDAEGRSLSVRIERADVQAPELVKRLSQPEQMARLLGRSGSLPVAEIAATLGISDAAVRTHVSRNQRFTRLSDGRIALATVTVP